MAFTLAAFHKDETTTPVTGTNIPSVADDHLKNEGDAIIIPELNRLLGFWGGSPQLDNLQIVSPSLRRTCLLDASPVDSSTTPNEPPDPMIVGNGAPQLEYDEELTVNGDYGHATADTGTAALVFLGDNNCSPFSGQMFTVKGTITGAGVEGTWKSVALALDQSLPVGQYKIVGARCERSSTIAFRFVFIGGVWRPGFVAVASKNVADPPKSRYGQLGIWGTFSHNREPGVEILVGETAGTTGVIYIDIMRA